MGKVQEVVITGDYQKANEIFQDLPAEIANQKAFQALKVQIAFKLDEKLYFETMDEYIKTFPNDPSIYLISIDKYLMGKEFDEAMAMVDSLDVSLYGDEFLDLYRGNISLLKGDILNAEKYFIRLLEYFPDYLDVYDSLLKVCLKIS